MEISEEYQTQLTRHGFIPKRVVGSGVSGTVLVAVQKSLEREVAVKVCDGLLARSSSELQERFRREAKLLAKIDHARIPYVLTTGEMPETKVPYTVMRFIRGITLRDELKRIGRVEPLRALSLCAQLLDALQAAHSAGVIHRDVKPENIMLSDEAPFLIDFSIGFSLAADLARVTNTGEHFGTADYMCPEQVKDMARVDVRCDLYSLGIVLFEMLTGTAKVRPDAFDQDLASTSPEVRAVVKRATQTKEGDRFQTASEFASTLNGLLGRASSLLMPAVSAICKNPKCPGANWSPNGYYRGPGVFENCTDAFCRKCGQKLARHCARCSAPFEGAPHCGTCGTEWFQIPECANCGSFLKKIDMGTDTAAECCARGRRKGFGKNDDIPF
ncbi:MAG TPA: protein kinase [Polyangiaceae bacterium]|nr:protein kinase [Polyangiaceae bacterium]